MAAKRRATAARIAAGLDLTPLTGAFLDWALAVVLEDIADGDPTSKSLLASRPHELSPIVHLLRCDDCAPEPLRRSILDAMDGAFRVGSADVHSARATALLCTMLATPETLDQAESILRGATKVFEPADTARLDDLDPALDPASSTDAWQPETRFEAVTSLEAMVTCGARRSPDELATLISNLATRGDAQMLAALGQLMPSFWRLLDRHDRATCQRCTFATTMSGIDPCARVRSIEVLLEGLLATRGDDDLPAILARVPWQVVSREGWPVGSGTWRPPLDEAALDTLFARLVKLDGKRPDAKRMSRFSRAWSRIRSLVWAHAVVSASCACCRISDKRRRCGLPRPDSPRRRATSSLHRQS